MYFAEMTVRSNDREALSVHTLKQPLSGTGCYAALTAEA